MTDLTTTGRVAGAWYLGLALTGILGFLVIRPAILVEGDPAATLANLTEKEWLASAGVAVEMGIVLTQALAAVWFFSLFRDVNLVAGVAVAAFGLMNATAIMASAGFMATANAVAQDTSLAPGADPAAAVGLLYQLSSSAWGVGSVFFGLWLVPMGWVAISTGRYPRLLGWLLVAGGIGYLLSALVGYGLAERPDALVDVLALPATVAEFWMIGYLLAKGIRPAPGREHSPPAGPAVA